MLFHDSIHWLVLFYLPLMSPVSCLMNLNLITLVQFKCLFPQRTLNLKIQIEIIFFSYTHRAFLLYANLLLNFYLKIFNCLPQPIVNGGQELCLSYPFIFNGSPRTFLFSIWSLFTFFFSVGQFATHQCWCWSFMTAIMSFD